jgi:hypothetical protein
VLISSIMKFGAETEPFLMRVLVSLLSVPRTKIVPTLLRPFAIRPATCQFALLAQVTMIAPAFGKNSGA